MKILKPGKVEMRKFVCCDCHCEFVADSTEKTYLRGEFYVKCPSCMTPTRIWWDIGEPYEEPTPTQTGRERLIELILGDGGKESIEDITDRLLANGVTFREG